jgi:hypothetical protein
VRSERAAAANTADLFVSDMESSARLVSAKAMEDEDAVLLDDFDGDPRLRASQVGLLEDDEGSEEGGDESEKEDKEKDKEVAEEKDEPIYFQGEDNGKGFEVDTPQLKPAQGSVKEKGEEGTERCNSNTLFRS